MVFLLYFLSICIHVYFQGNREDNVIYFPGLLGLWSSVSRMIYGTWCLMIYVSLCWWNELWSLIKDLKEHIFHIIKCKRILTMEKLWLDKLTLWICFLFNLTQYQRVILLHHFFHCEKNTSFSGLFSWITWLCMTLSDFIFVHGIISLFSIIYHIYFMKHNWHITY